MENDTKNNKKTLNILHIAATDKENITSRVMKKKIGTSGSNKIYRDSAGKRVKISNDINKNEPKSKASIETNTDSSTHTGSVLDSDLTIDNPSENYWRHLAESRSKALKSALKENVDLHNKVNELEYENQKLKAMLDEAKALVEVLTEMLQENNEDNSNGNEGNNSVSNDTEEINSDSDSD